MTVGTVKCGPFALTPNGGIVGGTNCNGISFQGPEGIDCRSVEGNRPSIPYFFEIRWGDCVWILTGDYCRELLVYPSLPNDGGGKERSAAREGSTNTVSGQVKVYPNPVDASGLLNFDLSEVNKEIKAIQVTDLYRKTIESIIPALGQKVFQHQLAQPLSQGIYFVIFHHDDGSANSTRLVAVQ